MLYLKAVVPAFLVFASSLFNQGRTPVLCSTRDTGRRVYTEIGKISFQFDIGHFLTLALTAVLVPGALGV